MKVIVKGFSKKKVIEVDENTIVSDLKEQLKEEAGVPPSEIKLIFKGSLLPNDKTLKSLNIPDEAIIYILLSTGKPPNYVKKEKKNESPIVIPPNVQNADYFNHVLENKKVLIGIELIRRGILQCHNSGMEEFSDINISNPLSSFFDFADYHGPNPVFQGLDYENLYKRQLNELLEDCGFQDKQMCLEALINSNGNVDEAINWIEEHQD